MQMLGGGGGGAGGVGAASDAEKDARLAAFEKAEAEAELQKECVVCMDARRTHLFLPCGHLCVCEKCSIMIMCGEEGNKVCPICQLEVEKVNRVWN